MNSTAYRRRPLAQPSAAAMATSCGVSSSGTVVVARYRRSASISLSASPMREHAGGAVEPARERRPAQQARADRAGPGAEAARRRAS